jgi:hypothetical protein
LTRGEVAVDLGAAVVGEVPIPRFDRNFDTVDGMDFDCLRHSGASLDRVRVSHPCLSLRQQNSKMSGCGKPYLAASYEEGAMPRHAKKKERHLGCRS